MGSFLAADPARAHYVIQIIAPGWDTTIVEGWAQH